MNRSILVVAAHPDDELLGCAGTIARHVRAGHTVNVAILAEGSTSRDATRDVAAHGEELSELTRAAQAAGRVLGVNSVECLGLPDNRMDSLDLLDVVKVVEDLIARHRPDTIYTHHLGDVNVDHKVTQRAVFTAARPLPGHPVARILSYETVSSTEWMPAGSAPTFAPNWFVDISDTLDTKLESLAVYEGEMRDWPHPRSLKAVEHLARWRGAQVGCDAAEAFMLLRHVDRDADLA